MNNQLVNHLIIYFGEEQKSENDLDNRIKFDDYHNPKTSP